MDAAAAAAPEQPPRDQKRHNGVPVLAASAVLVLSALGWQLMGAGVVVHFLVLLSGIAIGALFRQGSVDRDGAADEAAAAAAAAAGSRTSGSGSIASDGSPANSNNGAATPASGQEESLTPSFLSNTAATGGLSSTTPRATASSPLHWVGETMEGSINWLCGNNGNGRKASSTAQDNGRGSIGGRRRSRSTGGGSPSSPAGGDEIVTARSAATSPARPGVRRAECDALPALGAGIPQEKQGQAPPPPARSRLWSRTFGAAGSGVMPTAEGFPTDAYDGDDSVEDDEGGTDGDDSSLRLRGAAGMGDWLVGAGLGDTRYERDKCTAACVDACTVRLNVLNNNV